MDNLSDSRTNLLVAAALAACLTLLPVSGVAAADSRGSASTPSMATTPTSIAPRSARKNNPTIPFRSKPMPRAAFCCPPPAARAQGRDARHGVFRIRRSEQPRRFRPCRVPHPAFAGSPVPGSSWPDKVDGFKYRDSDIRDGYTASATASVGKYFTGPHPRGSGRGIRPAGRRPRAACDDLSNRRIWAALDYKLIAEDDALRLRDAEWTASRSSPCSTPPHGAPHHLLQSESPRSGFFIGVRWRTDRVSVDARTARYELGVNIALRGNDALDLGWSHFRFPRRSGEAASTMATLSASVICYRFR